MVYNETTIYNGDATMLSFYLLMLDDESEKSRFEQIYAKYKESMGRIALAILKNEDDAFDAVSNAMVSIAKNIKSLPSDMDETYEGMYIRKIIKNASLTVLRKRKSEAKFTSLDDIRENDEYTSSLDDVMQNELVTAIAAKIRNMPAIYRDVLILRHLYGQGYTEISVALGIALNTTKARIKRGTEILRKELGKQK